MSGVTDAETCAAYGWDVGTVLRGYEGWANGGCWNTIRITAIGESRVLARCLRHERVDAAGDVVRDKDCDCGEMTWTLRYRRWEAVR